MEQTFVLVPRADLLELTPRAVEELLSRLAVLSELRNAQKSFFNFPTTLDLEDFPNARFLQANAHLNAFVHSLRTSKMALNWVRIAASS
jgi:hypothetical protein